MALDHATLQIIARGRRCYLLLDPENRVTRQIGDLAALLRIPPFEIVGRTATEIVQALAAQLDPFGPDPSTELANMRETLIARIQGSRISWVRITSGDGYLEIEGDSRIEPLSAYTDLLTGLPNRAFLDNELLPRRVSAAKRGERRAGVCVLLVDLNGFKPVNDAWGHSVGDLLLQAFAKRLIEAAQRDDPDTIALRQGGDEFVIVPPLLRYNEVDSRVAAITHYLNREPYSIVTGTVTSRTSVTASVGASWSPCRRRGDDGPELMRGADKAMYETKRFSNGEGGYSIFGIGNR